MKLLCLRAIAALGSGWIGLEDDVVLEDEHRLLQPTTLDMGRKPAFKPLPIYREHNARRRAGIGAIEASKIKVLPPPPASPSKIDATP
jgi:hypothetical protein